MMLNIDVRSFTYLHFSGTIGGCRLTRAAVTVTMWSKVSNISRGSSAFIMSKSFIRLITRSTWILALATCLVCWSSAFGNFFFAFREGREGVKWELGLALFWTGKMGFTHWDWDLATGNGMNSYKMEMGFLFFSGLWNRKIKFRSIRPCTPQ